MDKIVTFPCTGYCPYLDRNRTIIIEFFEILSKGTEKPGYKRRYMHCDDACHCPHYDSRLGCSLFREATPKP